DRKEIHVDRETISAVLHMCRRRRQPELFSSWPPMSGSLSGRAGSFAQNAERCPAVLVWRQCWLASILLSQERQTGKASAEQIANRVVGSLQFAGRSACR